MDRITYLEEALEVALSLLSDSDFKEWRKEIEEFESKDLDPEIWICRHCKGTNVSEDTWKDINTGEITDGGHEYYCSDCMSDTKIMLKGEEE
tara:strand:- start:1649 stop:1924 length:276 start_codon:yes stop_codon:yes gene_type:complete